MNLFYEGFEGTRGGSVFPLGGPAVQPLERVTGMLRMGIMGRPLRKEGGAANVGMLYKQARAAGGAG